MTSFSEMLQALEATTRIGANPRNIATFELENGLKLPPALRELYQASDGFELETLGVEFLPLERVFVLCADDWRYVALTDENDSNPYCVCCGVHLNGYIVHVFHDDSPVLAFRSITTFLNSLKDAEGCIEDAVTDFATHTRTEQDLIEAKQLMTLSKAERNEDYTDSLRFAATLFSSENLTEMQELLHRRDAYCREAVMQNLKRIGTPEALKVLNETSSEYKRFVNQCANRLYAAGLSATVVDSDIRLDPGPVWLNMQAFFEDRHKPEIFDRVIERSKQFLKRGKPPH